MPFGFEYIPAPDGLERHLNSFYVLTFAPQEVEEILPAYSPQLMISDGPVGRMDFGEGFVDSYRHASLLGPLSHAFRIAITGPSLIYGASFSFFGWASITRLPVIRYFDRHIDPLEALGPVAGQKAIDLGKQASGLDRDEVFARMADILRSRMKHIPSGHAQVIDTTYAWLQRSFNPDPEELFDALPYSDRQTQRLVKRFFGLPPTRLKRQYRALRAAIMLADPKLDDDIRAKVLDAFYDQAHMIREIREFTGRTPRGLDPDRGTFASATSPRSNLCGRIQRGLPDHRQLIGSLPVSRRRTGLSANDSQQAELR